MLKASFYANVYRTESQNIQKEKIFRLGVQITDF